MPGINPGLDANDPVVVAAFRAALIHQRILALLIFGLVSAALNTDPGPAAAAAAASFASLLADAAQRALRSP